jgi:hypothetical protein
MEPSVLSFTFTATREMAERVAQTLAYSETQGAGWMRAALLYIDLLPHSRGTGAGAELRVVLRADDADANRMLGVERWVVPQTAEMSAQHLSRLKVPAWVMTETGSEDGPARSNLACAKHLAELLLLLLHKMQQISVHDVFTQKLCFNRNIINTRTQNPVPPSLCDAQCLSLMELADAWRDHIVSTWGNPAALLSLERITEKVMNEESPAEPPPPKFDPKEFPALGGSPCRAPPRIPFGYNKVVLHRGDGARAHQYVPRVRRDDAEALGRVAWIGDPECKEAIWLRGGPLPQKIDWGPRVR